MSGNALEVKEVSLDYVTERHNAIAPPGFQLTEFGLIPEDWGIHNLGAIGEALIGLTYRPSDVREHGTLVLRSSNIQDDSLAFEDNVYVNADIPDRIRVRVGDVLICVRNGSRGLIGKSAYLDKRVEGETFGAFMGVFRSKLGKLASFYFQSSTIKRQINEHLGATISQITNKSLNSFRIAIPSNDEEQRAIATALSDVDALLEGLDRLIAKKRDLKQAIMQQLLTGQTRLPGFEGEWHIKPLKAYCSLKSGESITSSKIILGGMYPCYGGNGLRGFTLTYTHDGHYALIGRQGALCGNVLKVSGRFFASEHALVVTPSLDTDVGWLSVILSQMNLNQYSESSAQPGISAKKIVLLNIYGPASKEEQGAISNLLSEVDAEIQALEQRHTKTAALKQAMMQELLTGRIRLI